MQYVPVDGELELLPGLRLVPAPGHTRGRQIVVVETGGRPIVVGGDVAVWFGELDDPRTEGRLLVHALDPELVGSRTSTSHGNPTPSEPHGPLTSGLSDPFGNPRVDALRIRPGCSGRSGRGRR